MRIASPLILLLFSAVLMLIAIVMHFALPPEYIIEGPNIFYVPIIIAAMQVLLAIMSIVLSRGSKPPPLKKPTVIRWILLFAGLLVLFTGFAIYSVSLYSPYLFGSEQPVPKIGIISWLIASFMVSLILYVASRMNSSQRPNLMRYFAVLIAAIAAFLTTAQALIFLFAMPIEPPTALPFNCGLMTIAFLPLAFLILALSKDFVQSSK